MEILLVYAFWEFRRSAAASLEKRPFGEVNVKMCETRSPLGWVRFFDVHWYTFEQLSYEKGTRKQVGRSLETRILEKHNGKWKIAYLGYHYFPGDGSQKLTCLLE